MGYTHYFKHKRDFTQDEWNKIITAVNNMFVTHKTEIAGWDGYGEPLIDEHEISFNGVAPHDYETCKLTKAFNDFAFCKTAQLSYDRFVTAVLTIAFHYAPNAIIVTSDGGESEWEEGLQLAITAIGTDTVKSPIKEKIRELN